MTKDHNPSFGVGDHVHVASLGKAIVREVRRGDRYLVEIKGRSLLVTAAQLSPVDAHNRSSQTKTTGVPAADDLPRRSHAPSSIDLHGMTTAEAVATLDSFLNDAILGELTEVRVIHGRSGGRVKAAVHARLKEVKAVRAWRVHAANPGVTIVNL